MKILFVAQFETEGSSPRSENLILHALSKIVDVKSYMLKPKCEEDLIRISAEYDWMLFSTTSLYSLNPKFLDKLQCKKAIWTYDWMWMADNGISRLDYWFPFAGKCDVALTTDNMVDWGSYGLNHYCLRQGVDRRVHYKVEPDSEFKYDVAYTGGVRTKRRYKMVRMLAKEFGGSFRHYDTSLYRNTQTAKNARSIFRKICASSKVLVGDKHFDKVKEYWSFRIYQTLGCGGFLIHEYIPGLEKEFRNAEHLVMVPRIEDFPSVIRYYLEHEGEREAIREAGYKWVHREHTYDRRAERLAKILKENK